MKKVLAVSSTPRSGGNSDLLCDRFLDEAAEAGHHVEKILLKEWNIRFCTGCGVCNTTHRCVQKDDMESLLEKLADADVIVLATPVYFYSMCAQLKVMIDRVCPRYTELADKAFYLIATAAEKEQGTFDGTIAGFRGFLDCLPGAVEAGMILGGGAWNVGEIRPLPAMRQAYEAGGSV